MAQLWQARILLHGRLSLPPDPNPEFFALENVIDVGRWYSQFPIGGPAVLAVGAMLGAPWIVNPIFAGISVTALYWFARHAFGETQGRAVAALFSVTPMFLFMAGTWMNHVPVLCLTTIVLALLTEWEHASTNRRAVAFAAGIGLTLGLMATVRPLDAIIVSIPVGLFQLWIIRGRWVRLGELAVQAASGVIGVAPVLYANAATTGRALRFGYEAMWGAGHQIGFRVDPYGNVHTLGRALEYAITYVSELNMYLMAWPAPALLVTIAGLLALRRTTRWDMLLIGLFVAQVAAYASYSLVGEFLGPRFLYTAIPSLIVLLGRTPFLVGERFGAAPRRAALALILTCVAASWSTPNLRYSVWGLATQARNTRRSLKVDIAGAVRAVNVHNAVVFLREPLGGRLLRRLWGLGVSRADAAKLIEGGDTCSLFEAIRNVDADAAIGRGEIATAIARATAPFVPGEQSIEIADPPIRLSSRESLTPACKSEIEADARLASISFGPALPLEPIGLDGRLAGDIIYAADLGDHNEVLRERFGNRSWYRLTVDRAANGSLRPRIAAY
jgi:hypothetical protein